jgi:hypothetical protein
MPAAEDSTAFHKPSAREQEDQIMTNNIKRGAIVVLLLSAIAAPAAKHGQVSGHGRAEGVISSVRGGAYGMGYEGDREGGGGAAGVRVGFGPSSRVTVYAGVDRCG